jgi:hypothetical protein
MEARKVSGWEAEGENKSHKGDVFEGPFLARIELRFFEGACQAD